MTKPEKSIFQEATKAIWDVGHSNPIIRRPELPIIKDEKGNELMIAKDPKLDACLKKGIELMVRCYSVKGKIQDEAIVDAVNTEDYAITLKIWRNHKLQNERFKEYYRLLLSELMQYVENQNLSITSDLLDIMAGQVKIRKKILDETGEPISFRELQGISKIIGALQKTQTTILKDANIAIDARNQAVNINNSEPTDDPTEGITKLAGPNKQDIVQQRMRDLQQYLTDMEKTLPKKEPLPPSFDHDEVEDA